MVKKLIFIFVLLFTFILRAHNYDRTPGPGHMDEMMFAWSGIHLIQTGEPVSWSSLNYPQRAQVFEGVISYYGNPPSAGVKLYKPWLDQPPLFSYLVGYFADYFGADRDQWIPASYIRFPVIFISALTSVFIFLIAARLSGYWTGILAMLFYGTVPVIVFASRSAMSENLIALLFTVMIYLLLIYQQKQKFTYLLPIPLLVGMAGLSKPTGFFLLPLALYLSFTAAVKIKATFQAKKKMIIKNSVFLILASLPFVGFFFWWGLHWDPEIFWLINTTQSNRPAGFGSLAWYFITPSYDTVVTRDSWFVFSLLSAAYFIFSPKSGLKWIVSLSFVYWVIIVMISGGENDLLAWYRFPSYPMLAILGAWGLQYLVKNANFFTTFLAAGMLLGNRMLLVNAFRPNVLPMTYRWVFSALMAPSLIRTIYDNDLLKKFSQLLIIGIMIYGLVFNIYYIYNAFELVCESKSCPILPSTSLSTLHFPVIWRFFQIK